jgi:hypothetical protein
MLPIMISGRVSAKTIIALLAYKAAVGILLGFAIDFVLRLVRHKQDNIQIDALCNSEGCHCERGIIPSALHHTLTVGGFVLIITLIINVLVTFIGSENIAAVMYNKPVISHLIASVFGLIPNCAASVALTDFCIEGFISVGTMLSGLLSGAGVGILILFKINRHPKENFAVIGMLVLFGTAFGLIADLLNFSSLF